MRHLIISALFFMCFASVVLASELVISPSNPKAQETISLVYTPDTRFAPAEKVSANLYLFASEETLPNGYETELQYDRIKKQYTGTFTLPAGVVFGLIKFTNGTINDTRQNQYWDFMVYSNKGTPEKNAYLKAGIAALGNLSENLPHLVNYQSALNLLKKEIALYPDNIQAQIGLLSLQFDLKKIDYDDFQSKMSGILNSKYDDNNPNDVKSVIRALRTLNEQEKAERLELSFAKKHPSSIIAEELFLVELSKAESLEDFSAGVQDYLKYFPNSSNRERIVSAWIDGYLQDQQYGKVVELMNKTNNVPYSAYVKLAYAITDFKGKESITEKERAFKEAEKFLKLAETQATNSIPRLKPDYMTNTEWKSSKFIELANVYSAFGDIYRQWEKLDSGLKYLNLAKNLFQEKTSISLYSSLIEVNISLNQLPTALELSKEAIRSSRDNEQIHKYFLGLCDSLNKPTNCYRQLDEMLLYAKNKRLSDLENEKLNITADLGIVQGMTNSKLDISSLRGKVVLLEFWSSWCGPCKQSLPLLEDVFDTYKDSTDVKVLSINIWEKTSGINRIEQIKDFFAEAIYETPVYIDENNELPINLGLVGLPSRVIIDKNGKVQFIESGINDDASTYRSITDKIDLLIKE